MSGKFSAVDGCHTWILFSFSTTTAQCRNPMTRLTTRQIYPTRTTMTIPTPVKIHQHRVYSLQGQSLTAWTPARVAAIILRLQTIARHMAKYWVKHSMRMRKRFLQRCALSYKDEQMCSNWYPWSCSSIITNSMLRKATWKRLHKALLCCKLKDHGKGNTAWW